MLQPLSDGSVLVWAPHSGSFRCLLVSWSLEARLCKVPHTLRPCYSMNTIPDAHIIYTRPCARGASDPYPLEATIELHHPPLHLHHLLDSCRVSDHLSLGGKY